MASLWQKVSHDLYELLGVRSDANPIQLKTAYRKAVKLHHPDVTRNPKSAVQFNLIMRAYEVLIDPEQRASYDQGHTARRAHAAPRTPPRESESASRAGPTRSSAQPRPRPAPPPSAPVQSRTFVEHIWGIAVLIVRGLLGWIAFSFALAVVVSVAYLVISFIL